MLESTADPSLWGAIETPMSTKLLTKVFFCEGQSAMLESTQDPPPCKETLATIWFSTMFSWGEGETPLETKLLTKGLC